ncbi:MAG: zinc ABC transporter substrate-binding protein [Pedosphaera sp.]|nr:zinc ABC transporter substrate-binding protein [Pedosphaera sp.]
MNTRFQKLFFQRRDAEAAEKRRVSFSSLRASAVFAPLRFIGCALLISATAHAKLNVVVTTPDLAAIAKEVGGELVDITTLARPTEDPHFIDPRPSFIVKLNKADVLIEGGAELEIGWLPKLIEGTRNPKIQSGQPGRILANEGIAMKEVPTALDRAKGDLHAAGNPHFMMDPANARLVAQHLADAFGKLDAKSAGIFSANLKKFTDALDVKSAEWKKTLAPFKGREVVAYHNSWLYFAERFGLKIELFLEPKPGIPPSPAHLAEVIGKMKEMNARVVIVDPYLNRKIAETVARGTGAAVVDVAQFPGGVKGTEGGYIALMDYLVNTLAKALGEKK